MYKQGSEDRRGERLATALGWCSLAVGATELIAPRNVARAVGIPDVNTSTIRAFGARQVISGLAILARPDRPGLVWSRVGGSAVDVSYLTSAFSSPEADRGRVGVALAAILGVTALDVLCAQYLSADGGVKFDPNRPEALHLRGRRDRRGATAFVEEVATINKPVDEVYRSWKNFESFPRFMSHLESVQMLGNGRSRWRAKAPAGTTVEWEAETVADRDGEVIAWRSVEGSQIQNSGTVQFKPAPGARGTEVRVRLEYQPPAGKLGRGIAWLSGEEPEQQIRDDLRRFKQLLETGEIPISGGRPVSAPSEHRRGKPVHSEDRTVIGVQP